MKKYRTKIVVQKYRLSPYCSLFRLILRAKNSIRRKS